MEHQPITEVSDVRELTIDAPETAAAPTAAPLRVERGHLDDEEVAALTAVFASLTAGPTARCAQELNRWGQPVDRLRYSVHSWQLVTLLEREKMRR